MVELKAQHAIKPLRRRSLVLLGGGRRWRWAYATSNAPMNSVACSGRSSLGVGCLRRPCPTRSFVPLGGGRRWGARPRLSRARAATPSVRSPCSGAVVGGMHVLGSRGLTCDCSAPGRSSLWRVACSCSGEREKPAFVQLATVAEVILPECLFSLSCSIFD